ncbi:MAG TPA: hypothetical protein VGX92_08140 [Pyrinomonadaceae bacterium]|jgi:hypothetical protein|nr:hypothetical protein [Pyrinomonadaceae bacterium]
MSYKLSYQKAIILTLVLLLPSCNIERDRVDAEKVAERVHSQIRAGDYSAIYRESSQRFKSVGSESEFVSRMEQFHRDNGSLKTASEISYKAGIDSNVGRTFVLIFNLDFEQGHATERMIFTRYNGQVQLWKLEIEPID